MNDKSDLDASGQEVPPRPSITTLGIHWREADRYHQPYRRRAADDDGSLSVCHLILHTYPMNDAESDGQQYDVVIQTTSIGMSPDIEDSPIALIRLKQGSMFSDIIYNPLETSS